MRRCGASNGVSATNSFVLKTVKLYRSPAFASCSIAHIGECNLQLLGA